MHKLKDRYLHIFARKLDKFIFDNPNPCEIVFNLYSFDQPYNLQLTQTVPKAHFTAANVPFDKRSEEVGSELWAYVILFADIAHETPYKLTKINYERSIEYARPEFNESLRYRNCIIVKDDRNLVFTD